MKNNLPTLLGLVVLLVGLFLASPPARAEAEARIREDGVRLRKIPAESATTLATLELDTTVFVIKERDEWTYVFVPLEGARGWVLTNVLAKAGSDSSVDSLAAKATDSFEELRAVKVSSSHPGWVDVSTKSKASEKGEAIEPRKASAKEASTSHKASEGKSEHVPTLSPEAAENFDPEHPPIALISGSDVNLRAEPNLRSEVIATLDKGTKVYLVSISGPWYCVSVPSIGKRGFVFGSFVYQLKEVEITGEDVNLRKEPSVNSAVITRLSLGERLVKKGEVDDWFWVISAQKGYEGWVSKLYAKISDPKLPKYKVVGEAVNFRASPNVDADILTQLPLGQEVQVIGREPKWSLVEYSGKQGWVYSEYLVPAEDFQLAAGRDIGRKLAKRGLDLRGIPYRWGGESESGFDCSGFVYFLLREQFGLKNLPRRASEQYYEMGTPVDKEDLQVGDLVFFSTYKPGPSHVGVYIGDGKFVHASSAGGKVQVNTMSEGYYKRTFVGARRITEKDLEKYGR